MVPFESVTSKAGSSSYRMEDSRSLQLFRVTSARGIESGALEMPSLVICRPLDAANGFHTSRIDTVSHPYPLGCRAPDTGHGDCMCKLRNKPFLTPSSSGLGDKGHMVDVLQ